MLTEITNPYHPGTPVADPAMLFGRQDAVDWVELQIQSNARVLILSAQPLVGKTSFIKHVAALQSMPQTITVSVFLPPSLAPALRQVKQHTRPSTQNEDDQPTIDAILQPLIEQLSPQLALHDLIPSQQSTTYLPPTTQALRELLTQACGRLAEKKLLLYIDDLHFLVNEDLALVSTFLSAFMPILDECPALHLIFSLNQDKLKRVRHPLLDSAPTFHLNKLPPDASVNMITLPVKNILRFDYGITRRIAEINSHHPYYLTLFCHTLLNRQVHDGWVNQRDFDAALAEILAAPIEPFKQIWDESSWVERAVLASMAAMQGKHGPMMQQEIVRFLQNQDDAVVPQIIVDALDTLAERGVLVKMGAVSYRFHVELLRFWLREHTQPAQVLREVEWSKLAAQAKLDVKKVKASSPPIATHRPSRVRQRRLLWLTVMGVVGLLCILSTGAVFAFFDVPAALWGTPTPEIAAEPPAEADPETPVEETAPPTPTSPPPPDTPTPALVVARTLPSIAYMARGIDESWQVYVMNADGSGETVLSTEGLDDTAPIWSPDGRRIAIVSRRDGNREIYITDLDSGDTVNITRHPADDWTPAWSPDGSQLAFSSFRQGSWEIFMVDTACFELPESCRENMVQLTNDGNGNISPEWSPDGSRFAFNSKASGNWDIYTMAADGTDIRQITTHPANDLSPAWSPDGSQLAFESSRDGNVEIYVVASNGTTPARNITNISLADDHGPTWAPDGQSIVFYSNREGNWDIFSTTLDTLSIENLTQTPSRDEQTPAWRP